MSALRQEGGRGSQPSGGLSRTALQTLVHGGCVPKRRMQYLKNCNVRMVGERLARAGKSPSARRRAMTGTGLPLDGVGVVEMTHMGMGPTCGMILAQRGAEVIKVEPPVGDKTRSLGGMGVSFFPLFNRGKRSVVLDLTRTEDREMMDRLLA